VQGLRCSSGCQTLEVRRKQQKRKRKSTKSIQSKKPKLKLNPKFPKNGTETETKKVKVKD
jgi:hypothetical protein